MKSATCTVNCNESFIKSFGTNVKVVDVPGFGDSEGRD